jgi:polar amino acid transport system substrate-binding protein
MRVQSLGTLLCIVGVLLPAAHCGGQQPAKEGSEASPAAKSGGGKHWTSLSDLATGRFAVFTGTVHDAWAKKHYPKSQVTLFDSTSSLIISLQTGKSDVALLDLITARVIMKTAPGLAILDDKVFDMPLGVGFRKDSKQLRDRFNRFLAGIRADGTWDEMHNRWCMNDPERAVMPDIKVPTTGEEVTLAVSVEDLPYVAYIEDKLVGFDVEMLQRFAVKEKLAMKIVVIDFPALVPALMSGKCDMISDGMAISEERAKSIDFSDTYMTFRTAAVVLASKIAPSRRAETSGAAAEPTTFVGKVAQSFHRNLIVERRWLLILRGLWATVVMSFFSTILGALLGALACAMRLSRSRWMRNVAAGYIAALRGMPVVVLLMLIFYVAFASVNIDPVLVAVLAFGLNFGAYVAEIFRTGIEGIDRGQTEAGIAMGFTKARTFVNIILPQATRNILPVYRGEFISLVKNTSIVGYIGVEDLTRASDIIRSRTFDPFFPLVMVAAIYFFATWFLGLALDYIGRKTDPKLRRKKEVAA